MAKLLNGLLGPASGRVGNIVAASWKQTNYARSYVVPANPNTTAQQAQRNAFGKCVDFAKLLVGQIFNPYTDRFQTNMSGFNFFIKRNIEAFKQTNGWISVKITEGKLYSPQIVTSKYTAATKTTNITFSSDTGANGATGDKIIAVVYNVTTGAIAFSGSQTSRGDGKIDVVGDLGQGAGYYIWLFAARMVNNIPELISDSVGDLVGQIV